ncbi:fumarylacetoacetate hydrolase family protein [Alkalicoccus daliensis]|uniref:2-keto-4-pentenoate hydratase/2-oxohepta-3-ene-1,7-dioic acid hydratase (Catechol pathway) n=1 Tax=Alkalicoccus daliensis TaxID=745820 RepID=A0A1H0GVH7_9BACI|nr:fumarylacetoacetate hydrolase family protein [Alkalicoccus daliensis]SDO10671.1 2-keto-4-pentenoate hydratase/2-oxohepta-3-ene-1,7-dioic acid hydratase (catechol pathway) [Alkalicoccus daliensis]
MDIKNIYCVGRNYSAHAKELGNQVPEEPMFFSKPSHSFVQGDNKKLSFPKDAGAIHYEVELVIVIKKEWEKGISLSDLIEKTALGIDFTLRDKQEEMKQKRYPWLISKGFPNSAAVGSYSPFSEKDWEDIRFSLYQNGVKKQEGSPSQMIFPLRELVDFTGEHFGLGPGDLIFTGTPEGVGPVKDGDELSLIFNKKEAGTFKIMLN